MPCPRTSGSTKRASICPSSINMNAIGRSLASTASHNGAADKNPHTISSMAIRSFGERKSCVASTAPRQISTTRSPSSGLEDRIPIMGRLLARSAKVRYRYRHLASGSATPHLRKGVIPSPFSIQTYREFDLFRERQGEIAVGGIADVFEILGAVIGVVGDDHGTAPQPTFQGGQDIPV